MLHLQLNAPPSHSAARAVTPLIAPAGLSATHLPWPGPPLCRGRTVPGGVTAESPVPRTLSNTQQALNKYLSSE